VRLTASGAGAAALAVVAAVHDRLGGFASLQRGPHRLATLALLSEAISRIGTTSSVPETMADDLYQALQAEAQAGVLAGWPTVFIGPVERFLGQAAVAAGRFEVARTHLAAAIRADRRSPALLLRSIDAVLALEARSPEQDRSAVHRDDGRDGRGPAPLPVTELERIKLRLQTGLRRRH
jgi:hypothetical protein